MLKLKKIFAAVIIIGVLSSLFINNIWADSTITSVSLTVKLDIESGDHLPSISYTKTDGTCIYSNSGTKYSVADAEWVTSTTKNIEIGDQPKLKVYLDAESGYYFKGTYRDSNITIKGGEFITAKRSGDRLVITLKTNPVKGTFEEPDDAYWRDGSDLGRARWDSVDGADAYDVYLYRSSTCIKKIEKYKGTSYNFYPYMTNKGTYSFKVRAVPSDTSQDKYGTKSDWTESDEIYISEEDVSDGSGQVNDSDSATGTGGYLGQVGWIKDGEKWHYKYPDGNYQKNSWLKLEDKWYLFDNEGVMLTGWNVRNDNTYYLNASGEMAKGWVLDDNHWYYFSETPETEGTMCTGWIMHNDKWYFAENNGVLIQGWKEIDSKLYYFYPETCEKAVNTTIDGFVLDENGVWNRNQ